MPRLWARFAPTILSSFESGSFANFVRLRMPLATLYLRQTRSRTFRLPSYIRTKRTGDSAGPVLEALREEFQEQPANSAAPSNGARVARGADHRQIISASAQFDPKFYEFQADSQELLMAGSGSRRRSSAELRGQYLQTLGLPHE